MVELIKKFCVVSPYETIMLLSTLLSYTLCLSPSKLAMFRVSVNSKVLCVSLK